MTRQAQNGPQKPQNAAERPIKENPRPDAAGPYKAIYRAVYEYHSRHGPFPDDPEGWQEAAADMAQMLAAVGGNPFLQSLLLAVYEEMERQSKVEARAKQEN